MKFITIDISNNVYKTFRDFLELLPKDSFWIYDEDLNELTVQEKEEIFNSKENRQRRL